MYRMRILASTVLLIFLGCVGSSTAQVETAQKAPEFALRSVSGQTHKLSDFRGKYVVLEWINYGCPFVKKHYDSGNMQRLQKTWTGKDVVWLSICSSAPGKQGYYDAQAATKVNKDQNHSATAYLLDSDGRVGKAYGAKTTPHMFVIDPEGVLIYQGAIDSIRSANPGDIAKSTNYVDAALTAAMAGKEISDHTTNPYGCSVKY